MLRWGSGDSVAGADAICEFEDENAVFDGRGWEADGVFEADVVPSEETQRVEAVGSRALRRVEPKGVCRARRHGS